MLDKILVDRGLIYITDVDYRPDHGACDSWGVGRLREDFPQPAPPDGLASPSPHTPPGVACQHQGFRVLGVYRV